MLEKKCKFYKPNDFNLPAVGMIDHNKVTEK